MLTCYSFTANVGSYDRIVKTRICGRSTPVHMVADLPTSQTLLGCDSEVGNLHRDDPFGFLLAASINRGMKAENTWRLAGRLRAVFGHLDPRKIAAMSEEDLRDALNRITGRPRFTSGINCCNRGQRHTYFALVESQRTEHGPRRCGSFMTCLSATSF